MKTKQTKNKQTQTKTSNIMKQNCKINTQTTFAKNKQTCQNRNKRKQNGKQQTPKTQTIK